MSSLSFNNATQSDRPRSQSEINRNSEEIISNKPLWAQAIANVTIQQAVELSNGTNLPPCFMAYLLEIGKEGLNLLKQLLRSLVLGIDAQITQLGFIQFYTEKTVELLELTQIDYTSFLDQFDISFLFEGVLDIAQNCDMLNGLIDLINKIQTSKEAKALDDFTEEIERMKREIRKLSKQITEFTTNKKYINGILKAIDSITLRLN